MTQLKSLSSIKTEQKAAQLSIQHSKNNSSYKNSEDGAQHMFNLSNDRKSPGALAKMFNASAKCTLGLLMMIGFMAQLSAADVALTAATDSGAEGTSIADVSVTVTGTLAATNLVFHLTTVDGTALGASDYTDGTATFTLLASTGPGTYTVADAALSLTSGSITLNNDTLIEGDQALTIGLALDSGGGDTVNVGTQTFTITDPDLAGASIAIAAFQTIGEDDGATAVVATLSTGGETLEAGVVFTVTNVGTGTASNPADYTDPDGLTITFSAGNGNGATASFDFTPTSDTLIEEIFQTVDITVAHTSGAAVSVSAGSMTISISDVDLAGASMAVATALNIGEDDGATAVIATLTTVVGDTLEVDLEYTVFNSGGSASNNVDYTNPAGLTITFPAGNTTGATASFDFTPTSDDLIELDQTVDLDWAVSAGAGVNFSSTLTITIDDPDVDNASIAIATTLGTSEDAPPIAVVATLTTAVGDTLESAVVFTASNAGGSASNGVDYTDPAGLTITFPSTFGNTSTASFNFTPLSDTLIELDQTVDITIAHTSGAAVGVSAGAMTITIDDPDIDNASVAFPADFSADEGTLGGITVTLTAAAGDTLETALVLSLADAGGSTAISADYATLSATDFTFPLGSGDTDNQAFNLSPVSADGLEADESLNLTLGFTSGPPVTISDSALLVTIHDTTVSTVTSITLVDATPTAANSVDFLVTLGGDGNAYSDASGTLADLVASDFLINDGGTVFVTGVSVANNGGTGIGPFTVTVSGITGDGTLDIDFDDGDNSAKNLAGNSITTPFTAGAAYTIDNLPVISTFTSIPNPAGFGDTVTVTVVMSESVSTPDIGITGSVTNLTTTAMTGTSPGTTFTYDYAVNPGDNGIGTITISAAQDQDGSNDTMAADATHVFTVDAVKPTVVGGVGGVGVSPTAVTDGESVTVTVTMSENLGVLPTASIAGTGITSAGQLMTSVGGLDFSTTFSVAAGDNGTATVTITGAEDTVGNLMDPVIATTTYDVDTAPIITNIAHTTATGTHGIGATLNFDVSFSETVTIAGGTAELPINVVDKDGATVFASVGATSGTTLAFTYTVVAGDNIQDADWQAGNLTVNGTVQDGTGNDLNTALPTPPGSSGVHVDTAPIITNIAHTTATGTHGIGATLNFDVSFSETVTIAGGTAELPINVVDKDGATVFASVGATSGTTLAFTYTVVAGDNIQDADWQAGNLTVNGTVQDGDGTPTDLVTTLPTPAGGSSVHVDTAPIIVGISQTTGAGNIN